MSSAIALDKPLVVLAVDDHPLIRSALREVLRAIAPQVEVVEAANPDEGLALAARRADLDLVFLDLNFQRHAGGCSLIRHFRSAAPLVPVVVYTTQEDAQTLHEALALGAAAIIPKTHSPKLLQRAVEMVMEGGIYLPPELTRQLAVREAAAPQLDMSRQQLRILELLVEGLPNKAIARKLGLASSTVKNQLTIVFERLGVSNRTQAAISARMLLQSSRTGAETQAGLR
jgi:DNA-binding NarL/FixJ family response regulator